MNSNDCINCGLPIDPKCCCTNGRAIAALAPSAAPTAPQEGDATALLAEKAQRIERLEAALRRLMRSFPTDFDMTEAGWEACEIEEACKAHDLALAALSQPHPHGG